MSKRDKILNELNLGSNNVLHDLTKIPKKDSNAIMPHTYASKAWATEQADVLHLPDDDGYRYLLVVVDIATRTCDAEPMKTRDSKTTRIAMTKIFKRKIVQQPARLEVDDGSEFKGEFKAHFDKFLEIFVKEAGRHRQQSVVESKNHTIGDILNKRMLAEEMNNEEESHSWVDIVPNVIRLVNKHYAHAARVIDGKTPERVDNSNKNILPEGTEVRYQLDNPERYVDGKKLHGTFRAGDVRWSKDTYEITRFYLRPDQPPMYQVGGDKKVAYTRNQLQVVKTHALPPTTGQNRWTIDRLLRRYTKKGLVVFDVKWTDGSTTTEPRKTLIKDVPQMVKDFERR